jgi:hypothetical protein
MRRKGLLLLVPRLTPGLMDLDTKKNPAMAGRASGWLGLLVRISPELVVAIAFKFKGFYHVSNSDSRCFTVDIVHNCYQVLDRDIGS